MFLPPLIVLLLFLTIFPVLSETITSQRLSLAFVDLEGSTYFNTMVGIIEGTESITALIDLKLLSYDDALDSLAARQVDAVVVFPERFIADMVNGINQPVDVILSADNPLKTIYIREFMESAADEITAVQSAINTVWYYRDITGMSINQQNTSFNNLVLDYMVRAFSRNQFFVFEKVSNFHGATPVEFYMITFLVSALFLAPLSGIRSILTERENFVPARLKTTGFSDRSIVLYHFIPLLIQSMLCSFFLLTLVAAVHGTSLLPSSAFSTGGISVGNTGGGTGVGIGTGAIIGISGAKLATGFLCLVPMSLFVATLSLLVSMLFQKYYAAELFLVTLDAVFLVVSGTLIPYAFLPEGVQYAGFMTFHRWSSDMLMQTLFSSGEINQLGGTLLSCFIVLLISVVLFELSVTLVRRRFHTS